MCNTSRVYGRSRGVSGVSAPFGTVAHMPPTSPEDLLHQLAVGDAAAIAAIVDESITSDDPMILVAAALFATSEQDELLTRARALATSTRDRQLVAIATAHADGECHLVDALARDHLVDHPDNVLVAWIAGASQRTTTSNRS
jgi:hypothetical protein